MLHQIHNLYIVASRQMFFTYSFKVGTSGQRARSLPGHVQAEFPHIVWRDLILLRNFLQAGGFLRNTLTIFFHFYCLLFLDVSLVPSAFRLRAIASRSEAMSSSRMAFC